MGGQRQTESGRAGENLRKKRKRGGGEKGYSVH